LHKRRDSYSLVSRIEQKYECDDTVSSGGAALLDTDREADRLADEEHQHANARADKQQATTKALTQERRRKCPEDVPDLQDTVN
jgi:hypothetical protein